jgi:hypothetical protein
MNIAERIKLQLDSDSEKVSPEVASAALAEYQRKQAEFQKNLMIERLEETAGYTTNAVFALREVRRQEKAAKSFLDAIAKAEENFQKDGDWPTYVKARAEVIRSHRRND